jgi:hypothetical protein
VRLAEVNTNEEEKEMKTRICTTIASAVVLALSFSAAPVAKAQPLWDVVKVNMPYAVSLGDKTIPPGDYEIRQLQDLGGGSRVLLIYSDKVMKFEANAMTIPTLDLKTPEDTKVILSHIGDNYYFDKIWVQGKNYGYEFVLPKNVRDRVTETASTNSTPLNATSTTSKTETNTNTTVAQNETPAPVTQPQVAQPQVTEPQKNETDIAAAKPVEPEPTPAPAPEVTPAPAPAPVTTSSADRMADVSASSTDTANRDTMPATSAGWVTMLLASGALFGAGMALRRKTA